MLPPDVLNQLPAATRDLVLSKAFVRGLISGPMVSGMQIAFAVSAICCVVAAIISWLLSAPDIARLGPTETPRPVTAPRREPVTALQTGGRG